MTDLRKKIVAIATVFTVLLGIAGPAMATGITDLEADIATLLEELADLKAELAGLTGEVVTECYDFTRNLYPGIVGDDVKSLQEYLNAVGYTLADTGAGSPGSETTYFGPLTRAAVKEWQDANDVEYGVWWGYFGPISQAKYDEVCVEEVEVVCSDYETEDECPAECYWYDDVCNAEAKPAEDYETEEECEDVDYYWYDDACHEEEEVVSPLEGGAGSISLDDSSTYSAEEVGEGEEDFEILEFEITAEGSDIEIISIKTEFVQGTAADSQDLDDYAELVSIWFDGDKVGERDADRFSETNDVWTRSISLDSGVIVREDESEMLVVAITALSNLDSGDIDSDAWTVDAINVRFKDAQGVVTTEDTDADGLEQTFDFASFAAAVDLELKISSGDEDINDAHVLNVDDTNSTDNVELLSFYVEAEGDSDIFIKDLPVILTTTEAAGTDFAEPGNIVTSLYLYADGDKVGTESVSGTASGTADSETVIFDDIDYTVEAGDEIEFIVEAKLIATSGVLDDGDTISADITSTERNAIDAEDEAGEDLATTDMTGTATGGTHAMYDISFTFELKSVSSSITLAADPATTGSADTATYVIEFELTAFDGDITIDRSSEEGGGDAADQGVEYIVTNAASNDTVSSLTSTAGDNTDDTGEAWLLEEGEPEEFTLTVAVTASADHFAKIYLESINWDEDVTDTDPDLYYTAGLGEEKTSTSEIYLQVI